MTSTQHTDSPNPATVDLEKSRMDVYAGVRWNAVAKYGTQAVELLISLVLARLLDPSDYGLLGMAMVFTGFLAIFKDCGFGDAIVRWKDIDNGFLSSLFFFNVGIGFLLATVLLAGSPVCSWFYGDSRIGVIVAVLSIMFPISSLAIVPTALLTRRMAFDQLAMREILTAGIKGGSALVMAFYGWGVWTLVASTIIGTVTQTILVYVLSGWHPIAVFRWSEVRRVLSFGLNLTGFSVFNYFARNADQLIIGKFLGAMSLGYYSLAYRLMLLPRDAISSVIGGPVYRTFCKLQDDDARLSAAYLRLCGAIAFITFPMMLGIMVVAKPFVGVVLGTKWLPAVPLICILAPVGLLQSVCTTVGQIYLVKGRADWYLRWGVFFGLTAIAAFFCGSPWGIVGIATAYAIVCYVLAIPVFLIPFKLVKGLTVRALLKTLLPYTILASGMAIVVVIGQVVMNRMALQEANILWVSVLLGVCTYVLSVFCFQPPALRDFLALIPSRWAIPLRRAVPERRG